MDDIYQLGLTNLFIELGLLVIKKFKIETINAHLDSTSFYLHGEYNNQDLRNGTNGSGNILKMIIFCTIYNVPG